MGNNAVQAAVAQNQALNDNNTANRLKAAAPAGSSSLPPVANLHTVRENQAQSARADISAEERAQFESIRPKLNNVKSSAQDTGIILSANNVHYTDNQGTYITFDPALLDSVKFAADSLLDSSKDLQMRVTMARGLGNGLRHEAHSALPFMVTALADKNVVMQREVSKAIVAVGYDNINEEWVRAALTKISQNPALDPEVRVNIRAAILLNAPRWGNLEGTFDPAVQDGMAELRKEMASGTPQEKKEALAVAKLAGYDINRFLIKNIWALTKDSDASVRKVARELFAGFSHEDQIASLEGLDRKKAQASYLIKFSVDSVRALIATGVALGMLCGYELADKMSGKDEDREKRVAALNKICKPILGAHNVWDR